MGRRIVHLFQRVKCFEDWNQRLEIGAWKTVFNSRLSGTLSRIVFNDKPFMIENRDKEILI